MNTKDFIKHNNTNQEINSNIVELVEQYKNNIQADDDSFNLLESINKKVADINFENSDSLKSRILESLFDNDDSLEESSIYQTSERLNVFQKDSLFRDGFITLAGFSSSGKTSFAMQIGLDILRHNPNTALVVYSLDDSKAFLKKKIYKQLLNENQAINISYINPIQNDILKYSGYLDKSVTNRIHILESMNLFSDIGTLDIYRDLKGIQNYHKTIDDLKIVVIVDYIQILEHDSQNVREGLNRACKELKNIQKSFNCMLIALSQLSNEGNYRETSEIRNISDVIIKQYSEKEYVEKVLRRNFDDAQTSASALNFVFSLEKNKAGSKGALYKANINSNFIFDNFVDNYSYSGSNKNGSNVAKASESSNNKYDSLGNRAKKIYADNFFETDKFIIYIDEKNGRREYTQEGYYIKKGYKTKANKKEQFFIGKKMILPESKDFKSNQIWVYLSGNTSYEE